MVFMGMNLVFHYRGVLTNPYLILMQNRQYTTLMCIPKYHHVITLGGFWYPFGRAAKASTLKSVLPIGP